MDPSAASSMPLALASISTENSPYQCFTHFNSQPLPVEAIARPQMSSNSSSISSWLPVTFSPCHTKYSWNPYLKTPTDGDAEFGRKWYKQSNVPLCCAPYPISESPQRGHNNKTRSSLASSSTQESPALTSRVFGYEETPRAVPQIGGECAVPAVSAPQCMDEYFIVDNNSGSRIDDMQPDMSTYTLPLAVTDIWPPCETNYEEQQNMDPQTTTGIEQHQGYIPQSLVQPNQMSPIRMLSYPLKMHSGPQDTSSGFSGIGRGQGSSSSASTLAIVSHPVLRFKKMLPPPMRYDEALSVLKGNCRYPELSVALLLLRWYERLAAVQKDILDLRGLSNAANMNTDNKKTYYEILEWCPAPPPEENQTNLTIREWAINCNVWWEKEFDEKVRSGERRRGAGGGGGGGGGGSSSSSRYKGRHQTSHYHCNNNNNNGGSGIGRRHGMEGVSPPRVGRLSR